MKVNALKSVTYSGGSSLYQIRFNDLVKSIDSNTNKENLPCIVCYDSNERLTTKTIKDTTHINYVFVDIDSSQFDLLNKFDELNKLCYNTIRCVKQSYSGCYHIIFKVDCNKYHFNHYAKIAYTLVVDSIKRLYNVNILELKNSKGNNVLDLHNLNPLQLLFVSPKPYNINYNSITLNSFLSLLSEDKQNLLFHKINTYFPQQKEIKTKSNTIVENVTKNNKDNIIGNVRMLHPVKMSNIDRHLTINGSNGNDLRLQLLNCIKLLTKDNRIKQCLMNKVFDEKTINKIKYSIDGNVNYLPKKKMFQLFNSLNGVQVFNSEKRILHKFNPIEIKAKGCDKSYNELKDGEYLNHKYDIIEKYILNNKFVELQSPTGSGKTEFIKRFCRNNKSIVAVPYNIILTNYLQCDYYGKYTPNVISEANPYFKENTTNIGVFDRILYCIENQTITNDYTIIIDESHTFIDDCCYRPNVDKLKDYLKGIVNSNDPNLPRIVFVSATLTDNPIDDCKKFKRKNVFKDKKVQDVHIYQTKTNNDFNLINVIDFFNPNKKVVIFSDRNASKIYDNINTLIKTYKEVKMGNYSLKPIEDIMLAHSTKGNDVFKEWCEKGSYTIDSSITIATRILNSAYNINNEDEFDVIIDYDLGCTPYYVHQALGRFRKAKKLNIHIFCNSNKSTLIGADDSEYKELIEDIDYNFKNAIAFKKQYVENNNGSDKLIESLNDYYDVYNYGYIESSSSLEMRYNRELTEKIIDFMKHSNNKELSEIKNEYIETIKDNSDEINEIFDSIDKMNEHFEIDFIIRFFELMLKHKDKIDYLKILDYLDIVKCIKYGTDTKILNLDTKSKNYSFAVKNKLSFIKNKMQDFQKVFLLDDYNVFQNGWEQRFEKMLESKKIEKSNINSKKTSKETILKYVGKGNKPNFKNVKATNHCGNWYYTFKSAKQCFESLNIPSRTFYYHKKNKSLINNMWEII